MNFINAYRFYITLWFGISTTNGCRFFLGQKQRRVIPILPMLMYNDSTGKTAPELH